MGKWTVQGASKWVLDKCCKDPAGRTGGLGLLIQESILGDDDPPWNLIKQAMEALMKSGFITAKREYTMPSDGTPSFYDRVKITNKARAELVKIYEDIGFDI